MDGSYFPVVNENHTLAHRDAGGWEPSTASTTAENVGSEFVLLGARLRTNPFQLAAEIGRSAGGLLIAAFLRETLPRAQP